MNKLVSIIEEDVERICSKVDLTRLAGARILVTGASGLVGTYLLACLKKVPVRVIAVMQNEPLPYFKELITNKVSLLYGDLTDYDFCRRLPSVDCVIHAAGYAQPGKYMADPIKTLKLNTVVTLQLFEKLTTEGKFLFISTGQVYNGLPNPPFKEDQIGRTSTTDPRSCYIESKRCGEAISYEYRIKGYDAKIARLSLAYGPGTKPGDCRALNVFIQKAIEGKIDLLDSGAALRTYCYVSDAVEIIWHILLDGKEPIYNVGGNSRTTIKGLANKIGILLSAPVIFPSALQTLVGSPTDEYVDMTKVENEFLKKDYIPLDIGLIRTIEWQQALYSSLKEKP